MSFGVVSTAGGVGLYQKYISRDLNGKTGTQCAYHSSCSSYMKTSLKDDGFEGFLNGVARLRKCTPKNSPKRLAKFLNFAVNCPDDRIEEFFEFHTPEQRTDFLAFRQTALKSAQLIATGDHEGGVTTFRQAVQNFRNNSHVTHVDLPNSQKGKKTALFRLYSRRKAKDIVKADLGPIGNALRASAATVGGVTAAAVGGVAGALAGLAIGGKEGLMSGLGLGNLQEMKTQSKYGEGANTGTEDVRETATKIFNWCQETIGLESVSSLIGGASGLVMGALKGAFRTSKKLGKLSWDMGKVFGRNVSDEGLQKLIKPQGKLVIEKAEPLKTDAEVESLTQDDILKAASAIWSVLSAEPKELQAKSLPTPTNTEWNFAVFSDATTPDLESQEIRRLLEFEQQLPQGAEARVHIRRGGLLAPRYKRWIRAGRFVASVAGMISLSGGLGLATLPSLILRTVSVANGLSAIKEGLRDHKTHRESHWNGRRTYEVEGGTHSERETIASAPVNSHDAISTVSVHQLAKDLTQSFHDDGPSVAVFAGHGNSYDNLGGYEPQVLAEALEKSAKDRNKKTDLVIFDACKTATIEALEPLAAGARFALVSQLPISKVGLPWHGILKNLAHLGDSPRDLGVNLVEAFGGMKTVANLSLVDLEKLPALKNELERLAPLISDEQAEKMFEAGELSTVRKAGITKQWRRKLSSWMPGSKGFDLSRMLSVLQQTNPTPELQSQIEKVQNSLDSAIIATKGQNLGGLSVEGSAPLFDQRDYEEHTGMDNWGALLARQQPTILKPLARLATAKSKAADKIDEWSKELMYGKPS